MCPGIHVAERSMFTAVVRLLWAFDIERSVDKHGHFTPVERDGMTPGFMVTPLHYE